MQHFPALFFFYRLVFLIPHNPSPITLASAFFFPRRVIPFCGILAAVICSLAFVLPPFPVPRHYYFTFSPSVAYLRQD